MKLSELTKMAREKTGIEDPEILIVGEGGFLEIEVNHRSEYYDENYWISTKSTKKQFYLY
jgi:hypothetical protein